MYKRQFYGVDHGDNNGDEASSSDSSSLDPDSDVSSADENQDDAKSAYVSSSDAASDEEPGDSDDDNDDEEEEDEEWSAFRKSRGPPKVQPLDSSLFLLKQPVAAPVEGNETKKEPVQGNVGDGMVLRVGGVLKCRLCVKRICLSDETMKAHLLSKGHARSVKQLANGKLKLQLDSDGEEMEEAETHAERCERLRKLVEEKVEPVKRKRGSRRQRQRKRIKKKASGTEETIPAAKETTPAKSTPTETLEMPKISKSPRGSKVVDGSGKKSPQVVESSDVSKTPTSSRKSSKVVGSSDISKIPKSFKKSPKLVESPKNKTPNNAIVFQGGDKKSPKVSETTVVHSPQSKLKAHCALKSKGLLSNKSQSVQ